MWEIRQASGFMWNYITVKWTGQNTSGIYVQRVRQRRRNRHAYTGNVPTIVESEFIKVIDYAIKFDFFLINQFEFVFKICVQEAASIRKTNSI